LGTGAFAAEPQVSQEGAVTVLTIPKEAQAGDEIDYANAKPLPLPAISARSATQRQEALINAIKSPSSLGTPGFSPGGAGTGKTYSVDLGTPSSALTREDGFTPQEYGTSYHPFSTARADLLNPTGGVLATNKAWPYRPSGKLYFKIGSATYMCSASLIKPGIVVTAAHCVANYGQYQFYTGWKFSPGFRNGTKPYLEWSATSAVILTSYYNGTDGCSVYGIVCPNDVAVIVLAPKTGYSFPGYSTGWYGHGWDGYGFTPYSLTQVSQTGYPGCLDSGNRMQRNDSYGYVDSYYSNNTVIGSLMCGGSSGGPWLVNFGVRPTLTGTTSGFDPGQNIVVGVTSWGYTDPNVKEQGASPFTSGNIVSLRDYVCTYYPDRC